MIKVIINGANGRMGQTVDKLLQENKEIEVIFRADTNNLITNAPKADVVIDFSLASSLGAVLEYGLRENAALVLATTGYSPADKEKIEEAAKQIPVLHSATMSMGINVLLDLVAQVTKQLYDFDVEIIEKHHNKKVDSPSGVALTIANTIAEQRKMQSEFIYDRHAIRRERDPREIGISSIRGGTIVGDHTAIFAGKDEILEITHKAASRDIFAQGAIKAAIFLVNQPAGKLYSMKDVIELANK